MPFLGGKIPVLNSSLIVSAQTVDATRPKRSFENGSPHAHIYQSVLAQNLGTAGFGGPNLSQGFLRREGQSFPPVLPLPFFSARLLARTADAALSPPLSFS